MYTTYYVYFSPIVYHHLLAQQPWLKIKILVDCIKNVLYFKVKKKKKNELNELLQGVES